MNFDIHYNNVNKMNRSSACYQINKPLRNFVVYKKCAYERDYNEELKIVQILPNLAVLTRRKELGLTCFMIIDGLIRFRF